MIYWRVISFPRTGRPHDEVVADNLSREDAEAMAVEHRKADRSLYYQAQPHDLVIVVVTVENSIEKKISLQQLERDAEAAGAVKINQGGTIGARSLACWFCGEQDAKSFKSITTKLKKKFRLGLHVDTRRPRLR